MSDLVGYLRFPKTSDSEIISVLIKIHKYVTKKEKKEKKKKKKACPRKYSNTGLYISLFSRMTLATPELIDSTSWTQKSDVCLIYF